MIYGYEDRMTVHRQIRAWGHSLGIPLTRECALMGLSPGDEIELEIRVVKRRREADADAQADE